MNQVKTYNTLLLFFSYCFFFIAISYLTQSFLLTNNVFHNSYAEQLSYDRIEEIIDGQSKYAWVGYAIIPLIYALKFFLVACCLMVGSMFFDVKLKFSEAFKIALLADVIGENGQDTLNCVGDAYTNHGWASIALGLVSALAPAGLFVTTYACAIRNI